VTAVTVSSCCYRVNPSGTCASITCQAYIIALTWSVYRGARLVGLCLVSTIPLPFFRSVAAATDRFSPECYLETRIDVFFYLS